jgi:hypothetical protein
MNTPVVQMETDSTFLPLSRISHLQEGEYWWRVVARGLNQWDNESDVGRFTLGQMRIISPSVGENGVPLTPLITWTAGAPGTRYLLELSTTSNMNNPDTVCLNEACWQVPRYRLAGATTYYARVTAISSDVTVVLPVSSFTTVEMIPPVPVFVTPATGQTVLFADDAVEFAPVEGAASLRVQIASTESFPARTSYNGTIEGAFETIRLGDIKGTGKPSDGNTYYVRARYAYRTLATGSTLQYTDYAATRSFVYRALKRGDVNADGEISIADINVAIDDILTGDAAAGSLSDVNGDGEVNIADVNALIDMILRL